MCFLDDQRGNQADNVVSGYRDDDALLGCRLTAFAPLASPSLSKPAAIASIISAVSLADTIVPMGHADAAGPFLHHLAALYGIITL